MVNSRANQVEVRLPARKNVEILTALSDLVDGPGAIIKHDEVRKVAARRVETFVFGRSTSRWSGVGMVIARGQ